MNIILLSHPIFMQSQSMPRFTRMLEEAYLARGHHVQVWSPIPKFYKFFAEGKLAKWAGYLDQYVLFPYWVRRQLKHQAADTLYVFCDQALGPWVPLIKHLPHVVHAHDLLALRSALGDIPENPTSWTGKLYQRYIREGFKQAQHFISVSNKTRDDLLTYGQVQPSTLNVVYNGLNYAYKPMHELGASPLLIKSNLPAAPRKFLLHLGGSQWYKNLAGVMHIYSAYANLTANPLPLVCISPKPNAKIEELITKMPLNAKVIFLQGIDNQTLQAAYSMAAAFIFPSLAEGFGWPIAEAQACGCPVLTTDAAPMNEVGADAATYIPVLQFLDDPQTWGRAAALTLINLINLPENERYALTQAGIYNATKFDAKATIETYLAIYEQILASHAPLGQSVGSYQRAP